jgi:hypothetical protein
MRQKTQNHRNQGSIDKKIQFFLQSLRLIPRWVRLVQKMQSKNSHAWAPLRLACKIREQTYIAASNVAVFSSFLFADFIFHKGNNEYFNQHCIFCRSSDFTVSEAARIVKTENTRY